MTTLKAKMDAQYEMFTREHPDDESFRRAEAASAAVNAGYQWTSRVEFQDRDLLTDVEVSGLIAEYVGQLIAVADHIDIGQQMFLIDTLDAFMTELRAHVMEAGAVEFLGEGARSLVDQMNAGDAGAALAIADRIVGRLRDEGRESEADEADALIAVAQYEMELTKKWSDAAAGNKEARADHNTPDA